MKYYLWILALIILSSNLSSQTSDQTRSFVNRSHIAIAKVQKEIYRSGKADYSSEIKKSMKYQTIAIKLFKENRLQDAIAYSYKARLQCIDICGKMSITENFNIDDDEISYFFSVKNFVTDSNLLDIDENKKIEELDILDVSKFFEIELNIK